MEKQKLVNVDNFKKITYNFFIHSDYILSPPPTLPRFSPPPYLPNFMLFLKNKTYENRNKTPNKTKPNPDVKHIKTMVSCFVLANYSCGCCRGEN